MVPFRARAVSRNQFCTFFCCSTSSSFFCLTFPSRARGHEWRARTVWITFLSVTNIKLFSNHSVPRARGLTEPVLYVFLWTKNDLPTTNFYLYCISLYGALWNDQLSPCKAKLIWGNITKFYLYKQSVHKKFLFVLHFFLWSTLKWPTESMQSKAHMEKHNKILFV